MANWQKDDSFLGRWVAGDLTPEEKKEFENSREGKEFAALIKASERLRMPEYDGDANWEKINLSTFESTSRKSRIIAFRPVLALAIAAAITLAIVAYIFLFIGQVTIQTGAGEQRIVELSDGSEVILHASSTLKYNSDEFMDFREVELKGEAFFKVKEGGSFIVNTDVATTSVLGTSFTVKQRLNQFVVQCFTGKVKVENNSTNTILEQGDGIRIADNISTFSFQADEPAWLDNISSFVAAPVNEVVHELVIVYGIEVKGMGNLPDKSFTGAFPHNDVRAAIRLVFKSLNIPYDYDVNTEVLTIR